MSVHNIECIFQDIRDVSFAPRGVDMGRYIEAHRSSFSNVVGGCKNPANITVTLIDDDVVDQHESGTGASSWLAWRLAHPRLKLLPTLPTSPALPDHPTCYY